MKTEYNSMSFTPEEVKKGLHLKLLNTLLELNNEFEKGYNDIHMWTDGYCTIIDWQFVYFEEGYDAGKFVYKSEEEVVMLERPLPDNSLIICRDEEEYNEELAKWLKKNKGWKKNEFGCWYNESETVDINDFNKQAFTKPAFTENVEIDHEITENGVPQ